MNTDEHESNASADPIRVYSYYYLLKFACAARILDTDYEPQSHEERRDRLRNLCALRGSAVDSSVPPAPSARWDLVAALPRWVHSWFLITTCSVALEANSEHDQSQQWPD